MASITNELVTNFSFTGDISTLTKYNASFSDALGLMAKGVGIIGAVTGAMYGFANAQLSSINALGQLSKETDVSIKYLQEMGFVASVNGGSMDALRSSVIGLSEKIGEASIQGNEDFNRLGISVRNANGQVKSTEQVLNEVRQSFQGLSKAQQISFAQKLGIDKGLLQTLNLTNEQIEKTRKQVEAFSLTDKETAKVMAFNDQVTTMMTIFQGLGKQISLNMLPNMSNLVTSISNFLTTNSKMIKEGLTKTFYWLNSVSSAVVNTGKVIGSASPYLLGFAGILALTSGALLKFTKLLLFNPMTIWITGITALILAIDDLYNAFNGGKSVIQDWFNSMDIDIIERMKLFVGELKVGLVQITSLITSLLINLAKAGNFLGFDFDVAELEKMKKIREDFIAQQRAVNQSSYQGIQQREEQLQRINAQTQNVTVTQNIQGNDAQRVADLSNQGIENAINSANAQVGKGGR